MKKKSSNLHLVEAKLLWEFRKMLNDLEILIVAVPENKIDSDLSKFLQYGKSPTENYRMLGIY